MTPSRARTRPGLLTLIGIVSLVWASLSLFRVVAIGFVSVILGGASWMGGVHAGAIGTLIALILIALMVVSSGLSIILFLAGWKTLRDDPAGVRLHRIWAWISLALALISVATSGRSSHPWIDLFYAVAVLYVTGLPEVRAYFNEARSSKPIKPGKSRPWDDEFA